jgi:hypothetical protein
MTGHDDEYKLNGFIFHAYSFMINTCAIRRLYVAVSGTYPILEFVKNTYISRPYISIPSADRYLIFFCLEGAENPEAICASSPPPK